MSFPDDITVYFKSSKDPSREIFGAFGYWTNDGRLSHYGAGPWWEDMDEIQAFLNTKPSLEDIRSGNCYKTVSLEEIQQHPNFLRLESQGSKLDFCELPGYRWIKPYSPIRSNCYLKLLLGEKYVIPMELVVLLVPPMHTALAWWYMSCCVHLNAKLLYWCC